MMKTQTLAHRNRKLFSQFSVVSSCAALCVLLYYIILDSVVFVATTVPVHKVQHDIFTLPVILAIFPIQMEQQKKRPHQESSEEPPLKKTRTRYNRVTANLNSRIAKAMGEVLVTNLHETYRQQCLNTLQVDSGSAAGEKIGVLLEKFKGNKRQKAIKENSEKINENSP